MHLSRRKPAVGFTLMELVIVMLVMGILTAAAAPRYSDALARYRVDLAAKRLAADLEMARRQAKQNSQSQEVVLSTAQNSYTLTGFSDPDRRTQDYSIDLGSELSTAIVTLDLGGQNEITFDHYGQPDATGEIVIQSGSLQRTIEVDSYGRITVKNPDDE